MNRLERFWPKRLSLITALVGKVVLGTVVLGTTMTAQAANTLETNAMNMSGAPKWVKVRKIEKATQRVQDFLEWSIKKVQVQWIHEARQFEAKHGLGPAALAVSFRNQNLILLGPKVTEKNFASVLSHELVHVVVYQKYKDAIPRWLEEGLANYVARWDKVDYPWLDSQQRPAITKLEHPMKDAAGIKMSYQLALAAMELLAKKCDLHDLLQMSVGKDLERYLKGICGIEDLDRSVTDWIAKKAKVL